MKVVRFCIKLGEVKQNCTWPEKPLSVDPEYALENVSSPMPLPWQGNQPQILIRVVLPELSQLDPHLLILRHKNKGTRGVVEVISVKIIDNRYYFCV